MSSKDYLKLLAAVAVSELAGVIGSVFTASSVDSWYQTLIRPDLAPPSFVFAPVWTILFALMGTAAFLVWKKGLERKVVRTALYVFRIQIVLNTLWSIMFFGLRNPGAALIEIAFLWIAILATIVTFSKVSRVAAWMLLPYLLWVSFAAYLNYSFWTLN